VRGLIRIRKKGDCPVKKKKKSDLGGRRERRIGGGKKKTAPHRKTVNHQKGKGTREPAERGAFGGGEDNDPSRQSCHTRRVDVEKGVGGLCRSNQRGRREKPPAIKKKRKRSETQATSPERNFITSKIARGEGILVGGKKGKQRTSCSSGRVEGKKFSRKRIIFGSEEGEKATCDESLLQGVALDRGGKAYYFAALDKKKGGCRISSKAYMITQFNCTGELWDGDEKKGVSQRKKSEGRHGELRGLKEEEKVSQGKAYGGALSPMGNPFSRGEGTQKLAGGGGVYYHQNLRGGKRTQGGGLSSEEEGGKGGT